MKPTARVRANLRFMGNWYTPEQEAQLLAEAEVYATADGTKMIGLRHVNRALDERAKLREEQEHHHHYE